jgi:hypothetical protein
MSRLKRLNLSLVGLLPLLVLAGPAEARLNLLESRQIVALPANLLGGLRINFESSAAAPAAFAAPLDVNLLMALPPDFRSACASMIESWGDIARGTDEWRVRVLFRQADQVWLSFRCASHAPEYENDYDERPALLSLGTGKLQLLALGSDTENDSTLYHAEFAGPLALDGVLGVALRVTEPAENPCCDGPESRSGETWRIFADSEHGAEELLRVTTARDDLSHSDDPEADSATTYRAQIALDRDGRNRVGEVTASFRETAEDITYEGEKPNRHTVSQRSGVLRFRWNPDRLQFDRVE